MPTYASIGIWGAVILTALRALQGIGVGGEWGGSVLLAMEWSRTRGLVASCAHSLRILNSHGAPIVTFSYLDGADAAKARALVEQAIAGAVTIKAAH